VPDPLASDVLRFASNVSFEADPDDPNASEWSSLKGLSEYTSVEGLWSSRWWHPIKKDWVEGTANITASAEWIFIYCEDVTNQYVIKAKMVGQNRVLGRYMNINIRSDSTPWAGKIVNNRRIDGSWKSGRWDFRR
jgi:hypothetical protein